MSGVNNFGKNFAYVAMDIYSLIHEKIHELESLLASQANQGTQKEKEPLEYALDNLRHQVAEWVRTAENRRTKT